jgi:tRNA-specific adenosine deaminase 1
MAKFCTPAGDDIARCVLASYDRLPQKCKPLERGPGSREWVPLAGIVLASGDDSNNVVRKLECVALGYVSTTALFGV